MGVNENVKSVAAVRHIDILVIAYESRGQGFESLRARQAKKPFTQLRERLFCARSDSKPERASGVFIDKDNCRLYNGIQIRFSRR